VVEGLVSLADLTAAFGRLRGHWKGLFEGPPGSRAERVAILDDVARSLETVTAAARVSEEARPYVVAAYQMRLGEWRQPGVDYPTELAEAAEGVRAGFEMRLRTLRQMESGDEVLPDSGRDTRRSAARDICFFHRLGQLSSGRGDAQTPQGGRTNLREVDLGRLSQCYDPRRKLVREEIDVPSHAVEAIEFLVRLGASG
jgi:hypothetical protein